MDISSVGSAPIKPVSPEKTEVPAKPATTETSGPDRDRDQNDNSVAASTPDKAPPPSGIGTYVDKTA